MARKPRGKKALYFDQAERMYVVDQISFAEIAERIPISVRSLSTWAREGDWRNKRAKYLEERQSFHEELYEFGRTLMRKIQDDFAEGKEVSANQLYTLKSLLPQITRVRDYEDLLKKAGADKPEEMDEENLLAMIRKELTGG